MYFQLAAVLYGNNFNSKLIKVMYLFSGNFITDIILEATHVDIGFLNSGTFRSDRIHSKGPFLLRDLLTILPLIDELVVIKVSGMVICKDDATNSYLINKHLNCSKLKLFLFYNGKAVLV